MIKKIKIGTTDHEIHAKNADQDDKGNNIVNTYMTKGNPTGTGSFSLNRKADSTVGVFSFAEGGETTASGQFSHAEGYLTTASGHWGSHAEGISVTASGEYGSHAEGWNTTASGENGSHAEGRQTTASGESSHAEGYQAKADGQFSHAEGYRTTASGHSSHAEGRKTTASGDCQHVQGQYNIEDTDGIYLHIVGNGTSDTTLSNAHTLDWYGNAWFAGNVTIGSSNKQVATTDTATTSANGLMTSAMVTKLNGIATGANAYIHPTTSGNKHIPAGGSSGQILRWSADGTAVWGTDNNTTYSAGSGLSLSGTTFSLTDTGVEADGYGQSGNTSPGFGDNIAAPYILVDAKGRITFAASRMITLPSTLSNGTKTAGLIKTSSTVTSNSGYTACPVISGVPYYKDTVYTHPTTSGNKHIPSGGSSGQFLKWSADGTATWAADNNTTYTFATGDSNGQIKVTPSGGSAQNISVKGLGSAAYTASTAYATAAQGTLATNAMPKSGGTFTGAVTFDASPVIKNGLFYNAKNSSGTACTIVGLDTSNNLFLGTQSNAHSGSTYVQSASGSVYLRTGSTMGNGVYLNSSGHFLPTNNNAQTLGTSSYKWSNVYATTFTGALSGNATSATTATKLATARTISLTGSVTGSGSFDGSGNLSIATTTNHTHTSLTNGSYSLLQANNGNVYSQANTETVNLGVSTKRWATIYSKNALNTSSDFYLKENIEEVSQKYIDMLDGVKPVIYKFKSGDRFHSGYISQWVEESMIKNDITAEEFGGFCKDSKIDENGNVIEGEYEYSLRYTEFIPIIHAKLNQLEAEYDAKLAELDDKMLEYDKKLAELDASKS